MQIHLYKHLKATLIYLLLALFCSAAYTQNTIGYGKSDLKLQKIEYNKFMAEITPVILLKDQYTNDFQVIMKIKWFDRKGKVVDGPDDESVFFTDQFYNLRAYVTSEGIKLKDDRKNSPHDDKIFPPSLTLVPPMYFNLGKMSKPMVNQQSLPLNVKINEYPSASTNIELRLILYFGREKKNELAIYDDYGPLIWVFKFPERKSEGGYTCEELIKKFRYDIDTSLSSSKISSLENTYNRYSDSRASKADWQELESSIEEFYKGLISLRIVLNEINVRSKDEAFCDDLGDLRYEINGYLKADDLAREIQLSVRDTLKKYVGGSGGGVAGSGPVSGWKENANAMERYYYFLADLDLQPGGLSRANQDVIEDYIDSANKAKEKQESMLALVDDVNKRPVYFYNRKFNDCYAGFEGLIAKNNPEGDLAMSSTTTSSSSDQGSASASRGMSRLWVYIIMGAVALLVAVGVWKFFPFIKKGLRFKGKLKR